MKYQEIFELREAEQQLGTVSGILNGTSASASYFSTDECAALDKSVRGNSPGELTAEQLTRLMGSLDDIAAQYHRANGWSEKSTPLQKQEKAEKIRRLCRDLLREMGVEYGSNPDTFSLNLVDIHGIFERPSVHVGKLVAAIQIIENHAELTLENFINKGRSDDPHWDRGRQLDLRTLWLYHSLAGQYRLYWGKGLVPVSRSNGEGGPSIRYFQFVVKKISGITPTMNSVHDFLRRYIDCSDRSKIHF